MLYVMLIDAGSERQLGSDMAYAAGYSACVNETLRHISELQHMSVPARQRLMQDLGVHLRPRTGTADDDVTEMTSPAACDVTVHVPRRRLFDGTCDATSGRRRPLADIQPTVSRDPPTVSRSKMAAAFATADCLRFPFPVPVTACEVASSELVSRCVTVTQTTTTTLQQDQRTSAERELSAVHQGARDDWQPSNDRCDVDADVNLESMWRPW